MIYIIVPVAAMDESQSGWRYAVPGEIVEVLARVSVEGQDDPAVTTSITATVTAADLGPRGQPIITAKVTAPAHLAGAVTLFTSSSIVRFVKRHTLEELEALARKPRDPLKGGPWIEIRKPGAKEPLLLCRDSKLAAALTQFLSALSSDS
jgi:hypothetical protein